VWKPAESKVDQVAKGISQAHKNTIGNNVLAAIFGSRALGLPNGHCDAELSHAHTQNDSTHGELDQGVG
jgi:hypothetical protein